MEGRWAVSSAAVPGYPHSRLPRGAPHPPPMKRCIARATARGRTALRKISPAISAAHRGRRLHPGSAAELGEASHSAPRCCGAALPRFPSPRVAPQGCRPAAPPGHAAPAAGPEPQPRCGCGAEHRPGSAGGSDTPRRAARAPASPPAHGRDCCPRSWAQGCAGPALGQLSSRQERGPGNGAQRPRSLQPAAAARGPRPAGSAACRHWGHAHAPPNQPRRSSRRPAFALWKTNQRPQGGAFRPPPLSDLPLSPPPPRGSYNPEGVETPESPRHLAALFANSAAELWRRRAVIGCERGRGTRGRARRGSRGRFAVRSLGLL